MNDVMIKRRGKMNMTEDAELFRTSSELKEVKERGREDRGGRGHCVFVLTTKQVANSLQ